MVATEARQTEAFRILIEEVQSKGRAGEEQKEIVLKADLAGAEKGTREIAEGWAFEKTYHLIGEITEVLLKGRCGQCS